MMFWPVLLALGLAGITASLALGLVVLALGLVCCPCVVCLMFNGGWAWDD